MCLQLFSLREQQSKQRHSSGEDSKLSKTGSVEGTSQPSEGDSKEPTKQPKVGFLSVLNYNYKSLQSIKEINESILQINCVYHVMHIFIINSF